MSRRRPCFAEPPAESPSTMKISDSAASALEQSASLPGRTEEPRTVLRRTRSRAALAASAALAARRLLEDRAERLGPLLAELGERLADDLRHDRAHLGVAQPVLGLPLELGLAHLDRDDRAEPLAQKVAGEVGRLLLELAREPRLRVEDARHGALQAVDVRPALRRVDAVGKAEDGVRVHVGVPPEREVDRHVAERRRDLERRRLVQQRPLRRADVADVLGDAADVAEDARAPVERGAAAGGIVPTRNRAGTAPASVAAPRRECARARARAGPRATPAPASACAPHPPRAGCAPAARRAA